MVLASLPPNIRSNITRGDREIYTEAAASRSETFSTVTCVYINVEGIRSACYLQDSYSCVGGSLKLRVLRQFTIS